MAVQTPELARARRGQFLHNGIPAPVRSAGARIGVSVFFLWPNPRAGPPRRRGDPVVQELSTELFLRAAQLLHNRTF